MQTACRCRMRNAVSSRPVSCFSASFNADTGTEQGFVWPSRLGATRCATVDVRSVNYTQFHQYDELQLPGIFSAISVLLTTESSNNFNFMANKFESEFELTLISGFRVGQDHWNLHHCIPHVSFPVSRYCNRGRILYRLWE